MWQTTIKEKHIVQALLPLLLMMNSIGEWSSYYFLVIIIGLFDKLSFRN